MRLQSDGSDSDGSLRYDSLRSAPAAGRAADNSLHSDDSEGSASYELGTTDSDTEPEPEGDGVEHCDSDDCPGRRGG